MDRNLIDLKQSSILSKRKSSGETVQRINEVPWEIEMNKIRHKLDR